MDRRADLRRYEQYERNSSDANAWLSNGDITITTVIERLGRARSLVLEGINGASGQDSLDAIAAELDTIAEELLALANTTHLGRPIFAGVVDTPKAFQADGAYVGDYGAVNRLVAPGTIVQVNIDGETAFGTYDALDPANGNLFQVIGQIATDLRAGDTAAASTALTQMDAARTRLSSAQAQLGSRARQIDTLQSRGLDVTLELRGRLAEVEDVDFTKAIIDLRAQEASYQASLSVTARIIQPSLLDFLR